MMKSAGLPPVFLDSCSAPRGTKTTSPRLQVVRAGLPWIARVSCAGPRPMTSWSKSCFVPASYWNAGSAVVR
jgi:hypothetical protein